MSQNFRGFSPWLADFKLELAQWKGLSKKAVQGMKNRKQRELGGDVDNDMLFRVTSPVTWLQPGSTS